MQMPQQIKRKQIVILIGGLASFVIILILGMWMSDPNRGKPTPLEIQREKAKEVTKNYRIPATVSAEENWIALSEKKFAGIEEENKALRDQLAQLNGQLNKPQAESINNSTVSGLPALPITQMPFPSAPQLPPVPQPVSPSPTEKMNQAMLQQQIINKTLPPPPVPGAMQNTASDFNSPQSNNINKSGSSQAISSSIQVVSLSADNKSGDAGQKKVKNTKNAEHYLPAGAFATVVLLSGVDAPTGGQAQTNPIPVLLRVMDKGQLPNYFRSDVDKCHVIGAAYGDISSERANIRLETLTCVLTNGNIIETPIKGYVAGEDGKAGLRGRLVSKQGALIARSLMAGFASGIGNSIAQQYQQISTSALGNVATLDPNKAVQSGLATGTANSLEKISDFYIARANETYPILEIDANRAGEVILTGGSELNDELIGHTRQQP